MLDEDKTKEQLISELNALRVSLNGESGACRAPGFENGSGTAGREDLRFSREDLEFIIEATGLGLWWHDLPKGELHWNWRMKEHFWLEPDDAIDNDRFYQIIHPEDREPCRQAIAGAIAGGGLFDFTCRTVAPDGRFKWITAIGQICCEQGRPKRFLGLTQDITAQKILEEELQKSEQRFRAFMDNSPTTAWMKDEHGRYLYLSASAEKSFGVRSKWYGKTDAELFPAEQARRFSESDRTVLETGLDADVIEETTKPDGSRYTWWKFKFPFRDTAGNRYVGGIGLDITESKLMEEELRRRENILTTILRAAPSGVALARNNTFVWMNDQMSRLTGYMTEELTGKGMEMLYDPGGEFDRISAAVTAVESGEVKIFETKWKRKDGGVIPILLSSAAVNSDPGDGYVFTATDISEKGKAAEREAGVPGAQG